MSFVELKHSVNFNSEDSVCDYIDDIDEKGAVQEICRSDIDIDPI
jgi:hypothetical protein